MANVISSAVAERDVDNRNSIQGESLLLPLLQELLDKKCAHQVHNPSSNSMNRSASSQSSEESVTATVDSGTESGEDLRFLAAGLGDSQAGIEPLGPGLLAEVQHALTRLAMSLQVDSSDMDLEPGRKHGLLQLVARLQSSLVVPPKPPNTSDNRRSSASHNRFSKQKTRQNRHTVGVSSEELAAARKLMQEVVLKDSFSASTTPSYLTTPPEYQNATLADGYTLQKQNSDGNMAANNSNNQFPRNTFSGSAVKNATAKPFNSTSGSKSPTNFLTKCVSEPTTPHSLRETIPPNKRQTSLNMESDYCKMVIDHQQEYFPYPQPENNHQLQQHEDLWMSSPPQHQYTKSKTPEFKDFKEFKDFTLREHESSETDDDSSTVKHSTDYEDARQSLGPTPTQLHYVTDVKTVNRLTPVNILSNNDNYEHENGFYDAESKLDEPEEQNLSAAQRLLNLAINDESKTNNNRFSTKKLKMKRANTIDIPKPLNYYENDDESDDSILDRDDGISSTRRSNYLALRGPIRIGNNNKNTAVPTFQPKTENDKKFMAFIQKHNNNNSNVSSLWMNKTAEQAVTSTRKPNEQHNWSRKFGNIKTIFEKEEGQQVSRPSSTTVNSAKQFWQSADDAVNAGKRSYVGPKVNKQGTRQLQSLFEQKQQESKLPWSSTDHNNIVTGSLKVESNFKPIQQSSQANSLVQGKNYKFVPQPLPVNKFSHAPMSAFKPPPKRVSTPTQLNSQSFVYPNTQKQQIVTENGKTSEPTTPLFLYTPKHLEFPQVQPEEPKPVPGTAPWVGTTGEHRVLNIAASKFENAQREMSPQPKKTSKDKVYIPPVLQQKTAENSYHPPYKPPEMKELSSPYIVKNVQPSKSVRKLSDEYDNFTSNKLDNIVTYKQPEAVLSNYKPSVNYTNNIANKTVQYQTPAPVQTVQKNVQKFSNNQSYEPKPIFEPYKKPILEPSHLNHKPESYRPISAKPSHQPVVQKPRRASGEYDFTSKNDGYKSQIPYQVEEVAQKPFKAPKPQLVLDIPSSGSSAAVTPDNLDAMSVTSPGLMEYKAVSKVMTGPVSQQAVTTNNTPRTRDDHDMARSLQKMLKNISLGDDLDNKQNRQPSLSPRPSVSYKSPIALAPEERKVEKPVVHFDSITGQPLSSKKVSANKSPMPNNADNHYDQYGQSKPFSTQSSLEINDEGESVLTTKLQIPVSRKVYYNNTDPNKIQKRLTLDQVETTNRRLSPLPQPTVLNKSDSWHKLVEPPPSSSKPSPRASPKSRHVLQKAKSSHSLAVPKQFEAGISRDEVETKKKTVAAYFGSGGPVNTNTANNFIPHRETSSNRSFVTKDPISNSSSINRTRTAQKLSTQTNNYSKGGTLTRSRTMPDVADLFEENIDVDEEFENIFRASIAK